MNRSKQMTDYKYAYFKYDKSKLTLWICKCAERNHNKSSTIPKVHVYCNYAYPKENNHMGSCIRMNEWLLTLMHGLTQMQPIAMHVRTYKGCDP